MAVVVPKTVGESLYWSYANLAMAFAADRHDKPTYQQIDYIVRNKIYFGLLRGKLKLGSFLFDEKWKMVTSDACCYCGSRTDLTLDHLIPKLKGGEDSAENLIVACRSCNSSKKALDLLEWMAKRSEFPTLGLLRRYLKLAIGFCVKNGLMDVALSEKTGAKRKQATLFDKDESFRDYSQSARARRDLPFAIELVPYSYPTPVNLVWWIESENL